MIKTKGKNSDSMASGFVKKWAGFLKNHEIEKSKHEYPIEKHK